MRLTCTSGSAGALGGNPQSDPAHAPGPHAPAAACSVEQTQPVDRVFGEAKSLGDLPKLLRVGRGMASPVLDVAQIRRLDVDQLSEPAQAEIRFQPQVSQERPKLFHCATSSLSLTWCYRN